MILKDLTLSLTVNTLLATGSILYPIVDIQHRCIRRR
jgi:hypothetical protein